jgi:polyhydroxyalkanoate synthesis regulator protein
MFITHAAIMYSNGEVLTGRNYQKINYLAQKIGFGGEHINGFTNSYGEFVLPHEAAAIATHSGQIKQEVQELAPDDLWPVLVYEQ